MFEEDCELLHALVRRHVEDLPLAAAMCVGAAYDELTDPLRLPAVTEVSDEETRDPQAVIEAVLGRLQAAIDSSDDVVAATSYGRAGRELTMALHALSIAA